jgi:ubiquinone/menaquinone biosynthesis C-methylase UbiE
VPADFLFAVLTYSLYQAPGPRDVNAMIDIFPELIESNGILVSPHLLKDEPKPDDELGRLLEIAAQSGWRPALENVYSDGSFIDYVVNEDRLSLLPLLPLDPSHSVLEIGPGYGQMTVEFSKRVASLCAIDASLGQARFVKIRTDQEGCSNVQVLAAGEAGRLPFGDRSLNGVIMNLVFEWCGLRATGRSHEEVQRQYLSEIYRVLTPGGFFFISTKNRYSLRLLTGGRDEHMSNIRFGSALPRWVASVVTERRRQRGYLHSYRRLQLMLTDTGFENVAGFWAVPDMRWPKKYISYASDLSAVRHEKELMSLIPRRPRLAMKFIPASLLKHFNPGLTFVVHKPK